MLIIVRYAILYYTIYHILYTIHYILYTICCTILYYTILYYAILYYTILYYTMQHRGSAHGRGPAASEADSEASPPALI